MKKFIFGLILSISLFFNIKSADVEDAFKEIPDNLERLALQGHVQSVINILDSNPDFGNLILAFTSSEQMLDGLELRNNNNYVHGGQVIPTNNLRIIVKLLQEKINNLVNRELSTLIQNSKELETFIKIKQKIIIESELESLVEYLKSLNDKIHERSKNLISAYIKSSLPRDMVIRILSYSIGLSEQDIRKLIQEIQKEKKEKTQSEIAEQKQESQMIDFDESLPSSSSSSSSEWDSPARPKPSKRRRVEKQCPGAPNRRVKRQEID